MSIFYVAIYVAFLVATLQLLSFAEKSAAFRGTGGTPMNSLIDKGLRVWFLLLFVSPLLLILPWWVVAVAVAAYAPFYLDGSEKTGDRASRALQHSKIVLNIIRRRFKIDIVKEQTLPKNRQYLFAIHPHGILPFASIFGMFSEVGTFEKEFPGISLRCLAASFVFLIPVWRDLVLGCGLIDAARYVARSLLAKNKHSLALVPGGATEALYAAPGRHTLYLTKRHGFVRLAMQAGVDIIPVYTFGETSTYDVLDAKYALIHKIKNKFQRIFGISLPLLLHVFPKRTHATMVFGKPFAVPHVEDPSDEMQEKVLREYIAAVSALWHKYKDVYAKDRIEELTII